MHVERRLLFRFLLDQCDVVIPNNVAEIEATSYFACLKLLQANLNFTHFAKQITGSVICFLGLWAYRVLIMVVELGEWNPACKVSVKEGNTIRFLTHSVVARFASLRETLLKRLLLILEVRFHYVADIPFVFLQFIKKLSFLKFLFLLYFSLLLYAILPRETHLLSFSDLCQ